VRVRLRESGVLAKSTRAIETKEREGRTTAFEVPRSSIVVPLRCVALLVMSREEVGVDGDRKSNGSGNEGREGGKRASGSV
jgi:hypothetical protein